MIYKKMIKNVLLNQYYETSTKVDEYFNRKIPFGFAIFLAVLCQLGGGIFLTIFGIIISEFFDGDLILLYFSLLAFFQALLQARRDYDTYESTYDSTIFVFGYNNKKSIISNAIAYGIFNVIANPMVFLPFFVYPGYWFGNPLISLANICIPVLTYMAAFLYKNNRINQREDYNWWLEVSYIIKSIIVIGLIIFLLRYLVGTDQFSFGSMDFLQEGISDTANSYIKIALFWIPLVVALLLAAFSAFQLRSLKSCCCTSYDLVQSQTASKWVTWLAGHCKDVKVRSDLLIIARRRDLWKDNAGLAFILPNTVIMFAVIVVYIKKHITLPINPIIFLLTALCFEIVIISTFIFKNMSFMMFHNSEFRNINLYVLRSKDTYWLLMKKVKLLFFLLIPALITINIAFVCLGLIWTKSLICILFPVVSIVLAFVVSFMSLFWMHLYRHQYTTYEEFATNKISLSMKSQLSTVTKSLLSIPFLLYFFEFFVGKMFISNMATLFLLIGIVIADMIFAGLVCVVSISKWKKR